jgi:hypothetical protein
MNIFSIYWSQYTTYFIYKISINLWLNLQINLYLLKSLKLSLIPWVRGDKGIGFGVTDLYLIRCLWLDWIFYSLASYWILQSYFVKSPYFQPLEWNEAMLWLFTVKIHPKTLVMVMDTLALLSLCWKHIGNDKTQITYLFWYYQWTVVKK